MKISREIVATGAALALAGGTLAACGGSGDTSSTTTEITASANGRALNPLAVEMCKDTPAWDVNEYGTQIGANNNIVSVLGKTEASGTVTFGSESVSKTAAIVAKEVAPNNLAIAAINTVISAESGITSSDVAAETTKTFKAMQDGQRARYCGIVLSRILSTPKLYNLQAVTGKMDLITPVLDGSTAIGATSIRNPNTTTQELFGIKPVVNEKNPTIAGEISENWGITAAGQFEMATQIEGPSEGNGPNANSSSSEGGGGEQPKSSAKSTTSGNETGNQSHGTGASNSEGQTPTSAGTTGNNSGAGGGGAASTGQGNGNTGSGNGTGGTGSGSGGEGGGGGSGSGGGTGEGGGGTTTTTAPPETTTTTTPPTTTTTSPVEKNPTPPTTVPPCDDPFDPKCH